jgi:hypothetical protein
LTRGTSLIEINGLDNNMITSLDGIHVFAHLDNTPTKFVTYDNR